MNDGEHQKQHQQQNGLHVHPQPVAVSSSFGPYTPAQPSFSYPSSSFGHYAPHYTSPNGGSFPPNLYNPGGQDSVFNRTGAGYPMSFGGPCVPTSQMNGWGPHGFPYSSYGQAYPVPSGAPGFSPYPPASGAIGFLPSSSYAYASNSTYAPPYTTQAGYLNANQALDRPKDERTDPSAFGGYQ